MLVKCEIWFDASRDGYISSVNIRSWLENDEDLAPQAAIECEEWIARQLRIMNRSYKLVCVRNVIYWMNGSFHCNSLSWQGNTKGK